VRSIVKRLKAPNGKYFSEKFILLASCLKSTCMGFAVREIKAICLSGGFLGG
jgi:hypothetical protein